MQDRPPSSPYLSRQPPPVTGVGAAQAGQPLPTTLTFSMAAVLSLVFAGWAVTGRLGIFAAFAARRTVGVQAARSNDRIDTLLVAIAGVAVLIALAVWLVRWPSDQTIGRPIENLGLAITVIGVVVAVVGLYLTSRVVGEVDQVAAGQGGVTASLVMAMGFGLAALGLTLGLLASRR